MFTYFTYFTAVLTTCIRIGRVAEWCPVDFRTDRGRGLDRGGGAVDSRFGMERADAWELRPGENGPETAAPDATTTRHFVDELVKHAGHGNEAAGAKMKTLAMHLLNEQGWENVRDRENVRESLAGATQGTTTKTGPEDPAHDSQVPEMTYKVNKCQFDQITKRQNYKRSLLKCVDAMSQRKRKVVLCPCSTILGRSL